MELHASPFQQLTVDELYELLKLRTNIFVVEQNCPYPELDDLDQQAWHVQLKEDGQLVSYARVFPRPNTEGVAQIGRMVTHIQYRRRQLGLHVMREALRIAREELKASSVYIEAQCYAIPFYQQLGFQVVSDEFLEDGIPHVQMTMTF